MPFKIWSSQKLLVICSMRFDRRSARGRQAVRLGQGDLKRRIGGRELLRRSGSRARKHPGRDRVQRGHTSSMNRSNRAAFAAMLVILGISPALTFGQVSTATVLGTVTDPAGAVVPAAEAIFCEIVEAML